MISIRVFELAKEFGMSSKELLDRLHEIKIPVHLHASVLSDAYANKIRKSLEPDMRSSSDPDIEVILTTSPEGLEREAKSSADHHQKSIDTHNTNAARPDVSQSQTTLSDAKTMENKGFQAGEGFLCKSVSDRRMCI